MYWCSSSISIIENRGLSLHSSILTIRDSTVHCGTRRFGNWQTAWLKSWRSMAIGKMGREKPERARKSNEISRLHFYVRFFKDCGATRICSDPLDLLVNLARWKDATNRRQVKALIQPAKLCKQPPVFRLPDPVFDVRHIPRYCQVLDK